jgi:4-amino-4-deoxy-L-arabinose transferase-like glycosyltransferase
VELRPLRPESRWTLILVGAAFALALGHLARKATRDPDVPYLPGSTPAEWITFPRAPSTFIHPRVELETTFSRVFHRADPPRAARLRIRFFRNGAVSINGRPVEILPPAGENWKIERTAGIEQLLQAGDNVIVATARSDFGPGALWCALDVDGTTIASDETWTSSCAGSAERPARFARTPMDRWTEPTYASRTAEIHSDELNPTPWNALRSSLGALALCVLLAAALTVGVTWFVRRSRSRWEDRATLGVIVGAALASGALFYHNRALLPEAGFDAPGHVQYVNHMLRTWSVPLADQGWEMYQPPLYYALAAKALDVAGYKTLDPSSVHVVRAVGWLVLLAQTILIALALRRIFADQPRLALAGTCFGAMLPMQLYLYQYVTNEGLAATLTSAAMCCALWILTKERSSLVEHGLLGVLLGLALLTKFSALLALIVIVAVFAGRLVWRREFGARAWTRSVLVPVVCAVLVCGWYYARVYRRFGSLLVWNLDEATGFAWWQDPGIHTFGDYFRFGAAFERPILGALHSIPDALYTTSWGDGLIGGSGRVDIRPPWNYAWMSAGMWLAIPASIALILGCARAFAGFVRDPRAAGWLVLGLFAATFTAWISLTLDLPFFAQAKSVYASSVMIPLCAFAALGFDTLARRAGRAAPFVWATLTTAALLGCASFWATNDKGIEIRARTGPTAWLWRSSGAGSEPPGGPAMLEESVSEARDSPEALTRLSESRRERRDLDGALQAALDAVAVDPSDAGAHYAAGVTHHLRQADTLAMPHLELAHRLSPGTAAYALDLANLLVRNGRLPDAQAALERTCAVLVRSGSAVPESLKTTLERLRTRARR